MTLMKKLKVPKIITLIEILLITTILFFTFNITNVQATDYNKNDDLMNLDYTLHDPIAIINNGNFSDYGFTGSGLSGDPYIIENYNITDTEYGYPGLLVKDTTVYFEIRNCFIFTRLIGIKLENVFDGTAKIIDNTFRAFKGASIVLIGADNTQIINNTCHLSFTGISIDSSTSVHIYGNNCTGTGEGIELQDSPSADVINNICIGHGAAGEYDDGIRIQSSSFSILENNTCENYGRSGVYISNSDTLTISNNTFSYNKDGIYSNTGGSEFTSNNFFYNGNGMYFAGTNMVVQDNLCIGNYIGINHMGGHFGLIENNTCSNNTIGIRISGGHYGSTQDNICNGNLEYGIFIENSLPPLISRNSCNDNDKSGIWINNISGTTGGTISENICANNGYLGIIVHHSEDSDITDNVCTNDGIGIFDGSVEDYLSYNVVNNIVNGEPFGYIKSLNNSILFASSYQQFMVVNCHNLTIANHTLENVGIGIHVAFSYNITLANNTFMNSDNYGLYLASSLNSTIIHNVFNDIYCGAHITSSYNTTVHMNWNTNSFYGFNIYRSANFTFTNNMLWYSGIFMNEDSTEAYLTYVVENNYVNGYPLGYITSMSSSTISGVYGQLILVGCTDTTVSSLNIDDTFSGLLLINCDSLTIIDNDFSNNYYGVYLLRTSNCDITENEINYNTVNGIFSRLSTNNLITYNNIRENNEYGIYLERYGYENVIHHNNFYDNNLAQIVSYLISQAFDGSETHSQNTWYDVLGQEGNYWSDLYDNDYFIDGFDGARYDGYPLDDPAEVPVISEFIGKNFSIALVIPMLLIIQLIRKKRKNLKLKK